MGSKFQASNHGMVFLVTSPYPKAVQEPTQICPIRYFCLLWNYKGFKSSVPVARVRDRCVFLVTYTISPDLRGIVGFVGMLYTLLLSCHRLKDACLDLCFSRLSIFTADASSLPVTLAHLVASWSGI